MLVPFLLVAACHRVSPAEQARRDARDVAMVEAAQNVLPPPQPLVPQALTTRELAGFSPSRPGCRFADPGHAAGKPILAIDHERGVMRAGDAGIAFAGDPGSAALPGGAGVHYTGKRFSLRLDPMPTRDNLTPAAPAHSPRQPMMLTVRDEHDRPVLESNGELTCG